MIEKGLYAAPEGLESLTDESEPPLEIEIVDPESVNLMMGNLEIEIVPDAEVGAWILNTKTGETQHCWTNSYGQTPLCVVAEHRKEVRKK